MLYPADSMASLHTDSPVIVSYPLRSAKASEFYRTELPVKTMRSLAERQTFIWGHRFMRLESFHAQTGEEVLRMSQSLREAESSSISLFSIWIDLDMKRFESLKGFREAISSL